MSSKNAQNDKLDPRRGLPEGLEMFDILEDPRSSNATLHSFSSLIFIALSRDHLWDGYLRGLCPLRQGSRKMAENGWKTGSPLPNGISCAKTFLRLFAAIDPAVFGECVIAYVTTLASAP